LIVWKKNVFAGMKLLAIAFIFVALVSPWWVLTGDNGTIYTTTNTYLVPSKIITLTSSDSVFGGEISSVPSEFSMVLELITILLLINCLFVFIGIFVKDKYRKIYISILILNFVLIILSIVVFFIAMSEVTNVGVGSFLGSGILEVSVPGIQEKIELDCIWGLGIGLILSVMALFSMVILSYYFFSKKFLKN
jgi:hypothetical protein